MKRHILSHLYAWKAQNFRKPLILNGARQTGKTWILQAFGREAYDNVAYVNFELMGQLKTLFFENLDPIQIIKILSIELNIDVFPKKTLIIFDEIQECVEALNSLKYFDEFANQYHVCAAGSLLGVTLAKSKGFPVGKVNFLTLYPLNFLEFLQALSEERLVKYLLENDDFVPLENVLHEKLLQYFREYLYIGGMPAAVRDYISGVGMQRVREIQLDILKAYQLDFAKHAPPRMVMKINQVWEVIPSQLAKENKKFIYSLIRKGARAAEYEEAIQWLVEAGLLHKVYQISTPKFPISAYVDHNIFKIYLGDVGLLGAMTGLSAKIVMKGNNLFQEFRGALTENYVLQELVCQSYGKYYWTSSGQAEIDFVLQHDDMILPVEVKSGASHKMKSLQVYRKKYEPVLALRISIMNLKQNGQLLNIPFYLLCLLRKFLEKFQS